MLDKYFPLYAVIFLATLAITVIVEKHLIPRLSLYAKQPIYTDGPKWHIKKSGTPTMGGAAFLFACTVTISLSALFFIRLSNKITLSVLLSLLYAVSNALIGIIDDLTKIKRKENAGLTPKQKLALQFLTAGAFVAARGFLIGDTPTLSFYASDISLGWIYYPLTVIILVGVVNSANLTDGIDGLASSVAFSVGISLFYISAALSTETCIIASAILGASIGFLVFNLHPAKIFMGDTGSLFFGALIASCALTLNNPLIILFIAGVYIIEALSVILQVVFYKLTHKRIFKMAPIHHHLEKCGWSENKICIVAILLTFIFSLPAYILYLP